MTEETKIKRHSSSMRHYLRNRESILPKLRARRQRFRVRTIEILRTAKTLGCAVCGEKRQPCLVFHHLDPKHKERKPSECGAPGTLFRELAKCIVICANCHSMHHEGGEPIPLHVKPIDVFTLMTKSEAKNYVRLVARRKNKTIGP